MKTKLSLLNLEARDCPAFVASLTAGELKITFDEIAATGQSVVVSAANGQVTLNEQPTGIAPGSVRAITVNGSDRGNFIDLHFVSTATGFRGLDQKVHLNGRGGDDVLAGSQFGDILKGGAGFDQLMAGNGDDTLDGGAGADWLYPGAGHDTIIQSASAPDWCDRLDLGDRVIRL